MNKKRNQQKLEQIRDALTDTLADTVTQRMTGSSSNKNQESIPHFALFAGCGRAESSKSQSLSRYTSRMIHREILKKNVFWGEYQLKIT